MSTQLVGRTDTLDGIKLSIDGQNHRPPRLIAVTGIGGIGYEFLFASRLQFFIRATKIACSTA